MAQKVNKDIFKNAEALRDKVTKEQQAYITAMYKKWADDLAERAKEFQKKSNGSATVEQMYYQQLRKMVQEESQQVANGVYSEITDSMNKVSDAVVSDMAEWTKSFGFEGKGVDAAFANVSGSVVNSILTGSVYGEPGSWSLSKSIWGDNEKTLRDIYAVMAQGVAENLPISDIADMLSKYVNPSRELAWNGPKGAKLYKKKVDYSAQRLARTLTQHTYQQSMVSSAKDNPFVTKFRWVSNGSKVCELCKKRDGKLFNKDEVPLDHPNGQCILEPVIQDNYIDQLANWVKEPDGTYPDIDNFAKKLGYRPENSSVPDMSLDDIIKKYGGGDLTKYKLPGKWYKSLPKSVREQVTKYHQQTKMGWKDWYQMNFYTGDDPKILEKLKKLGMNKAQQRAGSFDDDILDFLKGKVDFDAYGGDIKKSIKSWLDDIDEKTEAELKKLLMKYGKVSGDVLDKEFFDLDTYNKVIDMISRVEGKGVTTAAKKTVSKLSDDLFDLYKKYGIDIDTSNYDPKSIWKLLGKSEDAMLDVNKLMDKYNLSEVNFLGGKNYNYVQIANHLDDTVDNAVDAAKAVDKYAGLSEAEKQLRKKLDDFDKQLDEIAEAVKKNEAALEEYMKKHPGYYKLKSKYHKGYEQLENTIAWNKQHLEDIKYLKTKAVANSKGVPGNFVLKSADRFKEQFENALEGLTDELKKKYRKQVDEFYKKLQSELGMDANDAIEAFAKGQYNDSDLTFAKILQDVKHDLYELEKQQALEKHKARLEAMTEAERKFEETKQKMLRGVLKNSVESMRDYEITDRGELDELLRKAIRTYSGSEYQDINDLLRRVQSSGLSLDEYWDEFGKSGSYYKKIYNTAKQLVEGFEEVQTTQEFYVRRGTDLGDIAGLFFDDFNEGMDKLANMTVQEMQEAFTDRVGVYGGLTSTSSIWERGFDGSVEVILKVPKGAHATSILDISKYGEGEGEFLLAPGTTVRMLHIEKSDGHLRSKIRVYLEVLV